MQKLKLNWQDPLILAQRIADNHDQNWAFLYSGLSDEADDSTSYICAFPKDQIIANSFLEAEKILQNSEEKWFGYLSYELGNDFEKLPKTADSFINLPKIHLINFSLILEFKHKSQDLEANFLDRANLEEILNFKAKETSEISSKIANINSNFSDKSYLDAILDIKNMIADGDFYQTNLTRKFFGKFEKTQNIQQNFKIFADLATLSPANYSSFLKFDDNCIISSSPELFLRIKDNNILSRPIKGTMPRGETPEQDLKNKLILENSAKERAENLMIVDLVRNDISRICTAGSVEVKNLFKITSYQNIHHMSSEIHGKIDPKFTAIDAIKNCFPAGSMTGAPKIKAITVAAKKEGLNRGVYSGTIGMFSKNEINSSVVIRTLITQKEKFEFQVGGAITFDSDPQSELEETFSKAKGIMVALKMNPRRNLSS